MLIDLNNNRILKARYDICVYGAGPAGITLARALAAKGKSVALFEGGGLESSDESQSLYVGKNIGIQSEQISGCRLRYFGGTSNHWGGRCGTFDSMIFERRYCNGLPGWPIRPSEVLNYLSEALDIVDIPTKALARVPQPLDSKLFKIAQRAYSRPPTHFGEKYLNEIKSSSRIHAYINANLVNIDVKENGNSISDTEIRNFKGGSFIVAAEHYVLALGAIENARILLNSDKQLKDGIGNHHGMVGRCFMDHLNINYGRFVIENQQIMGKGLELNPTDMLMKKQGINNGVLAFDPHFKLETYGRLRILKKAMLDAICESKFATSIYRKFNDLDCTGDGVISSMIEQSPNLESRVMLGSELDPFGLRRVILDWRVSDIDRKTIRVLGVEVAKEMARKRMARVQLQEFILDEHKEITGIDRHCHHIGTTRMSSDPRFGVVDTNSKVHGISNLYIAGSSVFPTSGGINPTLTIIMLTLKLSEHLSNLLS